MHRFNEINQTTARRIDGMLRGMSTLGTFEELEKRFVQESARIVPGDCLCWNTWAPDLSHLIDFHANDDYGKRLISLLPALNEMVIHHPVVAANRLHLATDQVMRISDHQSDAGFRENPLFREVYRHLDSHYQISYIPCVLRDRQITLTWNRRAFDFTERERQLFHYMGIRLGIICRRLEERRSLDGILREVCGFVGARIPEESVAALGTTDVSLIAEVMKGVSREMIAARRGVRRDSLDKRFGSIREKLGLENHHQLLSAMAELRKR